MTDKMTLQGAIAWGDLLHGNPQCDTPTYWQTIRDELHRLAEIAGSVDPLVIKLHEVTTKLEAANALLRECYEWLFESLSDGPRVSEGAIEKHYYTPALEAFHGRIQSHLQGAGDA